MSVSTLRATALGLLKNFDMSSTQLTSSLDMIRYIVTMFHGNWILKAKEDRKSLSKPTPAALLTKNKCRFSVPFAQHQKI